MRLIDADKFFMKAYNVAYPVIHGNNDRENGLTMYGIAQILDEQPIIDAVPVVRCKDCKFLADGKCFFTTKPKDQYDYCSLGEKVTENG